MPNSIGYAILKISKKKFPTTQIVYFFSTGRNAVALDRTHSQCLVLLPSPPSATPLFLLCPWQSMLQTTPEQPPKMRTMYIEAIHMQLQFCVKFFQGCKTAFHPIFSCCIESFWKKIGLKFCLDTIYLCFHI